MIDLSDFWQMLLAVLAFSALVFVHELGHYLAAKFVGVRVERFFIGFDAWGLAIQKEYKGCVYGIGILPLGGYVKLAGQSDDPRETNQQGKPDELPNKPLWAQGLVYAAGVIMNMIFGYCLLVGAYVYGVPFSPNVVGSVEINSPAAASGLQSGDRIVAIDGEPMKTFEDIQQYIVINPEKTFTFDVERPSAKGDTNTERLQLRVRGEASELRGKIYQTGIRPPISRVIGELPEEGDAAALVTNLRVGDEILSFNGKAIPDKYHGHMLIEEIDRAPGQSAVPVKLLRDGKEVDTTVAVGGHGLYDIGVSFYVVCGDVLPDSPAQRAGLKGGDKIYAVEENGAPRWLRDQGDLIKTTQAASLLPVELTVVRPAPQGQTTEPETLTVTVDPRFLGSDIRIPIGEDNFLGVLTRTAKDGFAVTEVFPDGPSHGLLRAGDTITAIAGNKVDPARALGGQIDAQSTRELKLLVDGRTTPVSLKPAVSAKTGVPRIGILMRGEMLVSRVEPGMIADRNGVLAGSLLSEFALSPDLKTTRMTWTDPEGKKKEAKFDTPEAVAMAPLNNGIGGDLPLSLYSTRDSRKIAHVLPAMRVAFRETVGMSLSIYNFLHKMTTGRIRIDAAGGPVQMFRALKVNSGESIGRFVWLVALLSINLAVVNILPIPVLDGGHILFLVIEGIYILFMRRKPNEKTMGRIKEISQYAGVFCLLALILTITSFDLYYWVSGNG